MSVEFEAPPINEVVLGIYFEPITALKLETIGVYWDKIRAEFPTVTQNTPLRNLLTLPGELFPLPRFWFISKDETRLIQIQRDAFLFNWRRRDTDYPRFFRIFPDFYSQFLQFESFLNDVLGVKGITRTALELTYVDVLGSAEAIESIRDYPKAVPTFSQIEIGSQRAVPQGFNHNDVFQISSEMQLSVVQRTTHQLDNNEMSFFLELRAFGASTRSLDAWFSEAHDLIVQTFTQITSDEVQKVWKKK